MTLAIIGLALLGLSFVEGVLGAMGCFGLCSRLDDALFYAFPVQIAVAVTLALVGLVLAA